VIIETRSDFFLKKIVLAKALAEKGIEMLLSLRPKFENIQTIVPENLFYR
jgi:hypothetical protein